MRLRVNGECWQVFEVAGVAHTMGELGAPKRFTQEALDGAASLEKRVILLEKRLKKKAKTSTFFHELVHIAINGHYGEKKEEQLVLLVEEVVFPILWQFGFRFP